MQETGLEHTCARVFPFVVLKNITDNFSEERIIGRGGSGVVYKGILHNEEVIAVKKLHHDHFDSSGKKIGNCEVQFHNEVMNLFGVQHPNVIRLLGYCYEVQNTVTEYDGKHVFASVEERVLCLEYMEGGSLKDHISDESYGFEWQTRYNIIKGVCEGLKYLHTGSKNPIYHLDLKPENIWLDRNMIPKIGKFGISRLPAGSMQTYATENPVSGTIGYMAPEYIGWNQISQKCDVYSLGCIMIRVIAGEKGPQNYDPHKPSEEFIERILKNWGKRLKATMSQDSLQQVKTCTEIALKCVEFDREKRPTITYIVDELNKIDQNTEEEEHTTLERQPDIQGQKEMQENISTGMHAGSLRSHSRGSDYSENKLFSNISGKHVPDANDKIEDYESRSRKQHQNPPGYDVFHKEQQSDDSPRFDYSGAQGNLGRMQSGDYDLSSEEESESPKLKGTSSEIRRANENRPLSFRVPTSVASDDNDEGDLGLNYGRLTPGLRNKPRQPPQYKNSGGNVMPKQSLQKAPSSIEEPAYSKENDMSSEQISDTPKSSRTTKNSVVTDYSSEHYDRKHTVEKPVESRSSMTRNYFGSGDTGKLSERSRTTPSTNPITTSSPISASSSQDLRHERPSIGVRREGRSRNARTYFDSDGSEEELEPRQTGQTKLSKEQIQSRRTREVTSNTNRVGRVRTGAQYAAETESTPKERKNPAEAFSNSSTEQNRVAPPYSRVSVQQSSPKPVRIEPPTARGKWQEDEPDESSSEDEGNTETSAGTPKRSTPTPAPAHIHPKLPTDYDSFAAHFKSLRTNRR